jgi:hypothetical protein
MLEAVRSPAVELVNVSIQLDQDVRMPAEKIEALAKEFKTHHFASDILTSLVVNHFYMYEVPFETKQRLCAALEVKYKPLQMINPRPRLVSGS